MALRWFKNIALFIILLSPASLLGQGDILDIVGTKEVENINPVYKPIIGVGIGAYNFLGDVKNPNLTLFNGSPGYKLNVATFVDNNHYIRANFFLMGGSLSGNERSAPDPARNMNFKSDILMFGVNLNYDFDNFYKTYRKLHPFVSVGFEMINFDTKTDVLGENGERYNYWLDGSIRSAPESISDNSAALLKRDYDYESNIKDEYEFGMGNYAQYGFAIPVDIGLDYFLTDRVMFRIGASFNYSFSDLIDHVSHANTEGVIGNKQNDHFVFSYFSLHLDLFSSDKTLTWERLFAEIEFDPTLMGDEDGDGYFDGVDQCPGTPFGVQVDTSGCPFDDDLDGIPSFLDDEPLSRYGVFVDARGVEMSVEEVINSLDMSEAVDRENIDQYIRTPSSYADYKRFIAKDIPEEFKPIDGDEDGYISFDEMMNAIDGFFDFDSELSPDDIEKLNNFFFSQ